MFMNNGHGNAEHANQPFSFNPSIASIVAFCRGSSRWEDPAAEVDMFSRWIKLSDDLLAANRKPRKKPAARGRSKWPSFCQRSPLDLGSSTASVRCAE
jgi:hypothetical protein